MTKEIQLTQGKVALVDDEDFEYVNQFKWYSSEDGYVRGKNSTLMHRFILKVPKGLLTDHINHNKLDNRKSNLRICNQSQNMANSLTTYRSLSGYKGVTFQKISNKWRATIVYNYKRIHLGLFNNIEDAKKVYDAKAIELFGEFAHPG